MLSLFRYLSVTSITTFGNWDSSSARFARRRTLGKNIEICTKFPTTRKNIHIRKVHDEVRVNNAQNERFDRQI